MPEARWGRSPNTAALLGALCVLPFVAANTIVSNRIEPFFSLIRPGAHTSGFPTATERRQLAEVRVDAQPAEVGRPRDDEGS